MKHLLLILLVALTVKISYSQVEVGKTKNTVAGKGKILAGIADEVVLDNFSINIILYAYGEDQGGGMGSSATATVGIRTHLTEVDEQMAQDIANESYAYFVSQWEKRGIKVVVPTTSEIESSKKFSKAKSKGKNAEITNGGVWDNAQKKNHNMMAWPEGVNIASSGQGPMAAFGNFANMVSELVSKDAAYTSFGTTINYMTFKTAKLGTTASVTPKPQLEAANTMAAGKWTKNKLGSYLGSNNPKGITDFYSELDQDGFEFLGQSSNDWNYIADKEKFKSNVTEMIQQGMDAIFADYDAVIADNTK